MQFDWNLNLAFSIKWWEVWLIFLLDAVIGDPEWIFHPVVAMGKTIELLEAWIRSHLRFLTERLQGVVFWFLIAGMWFCTYFLTSLVLRALALKGGLLGLISECVFLFLGAQFLALRGLLGAATKVEKLLVQEELEKARVELKALVGRDTDTLTSLEIKKAVVESLAENFNDAVIAPLFYFCVAGLPGLATYKVVNTMDSMVGYKTPRYVKFGWFAARMDDIFNFVPARIAGVLLVFSCCILRGISSGLRSLKVLLKDWNKHSSPNSGVPESAMAGCLGIQLGGPSFYFGKLVKKPYIGIGIEPVTLETLSLAKRLVILAALLGSVLFATFVKFWGGAFF